MVKLFIPTQEVFLEVTDEEEAIIVQEKLHKENNISVWIIYTN